MIHLRPSHFPLLLFSSPHLYPDLAWWLCLPPCPFPSFSSPPFTIVRVVPFLSPSPWLKEIIVSFLLLLPSILPACNLQIGEVASFPGLPTIQIFYCLQHTNGWGGGRSCLNNEWQGFGCENVWCLCQHCMKSLQDCLFRSGAFLPFNRHSCGQCTKVPSPPPSIFA